MNILHRKISFYHGRHNIMEVLENLCYLDNQSISSQLVQITLTAEHAKYLPCKILILTMQNWLKNGKICIMRSSSTCRRFFPAIIIVQCDMSCCSFH